MAKRIGQRVALLGLGLSLLMVPLLTLGSCAGGGASPTATSATEGQKSTFDVKVAEVRQYSELGDKRADGQYILVRLNLTNQTDGDRSIAYETVTLALQPEGQAKPTYQQPQELGANILLIKDKSFGLRESERIFKAPADTFHPQVETQRYSMFVVPADADLSQYHLRWQPAQTGGGGAFGGAPAGGAAPMTGFDLKLVGPQTIIKDLRTHGDAA